MNGDQVRGTGFLPARQVGYSGAEVDDLLRRMAAELDAGRPVGPLIRDVTFTQGSGASGYDVEAVDWFLEELLRREGQPEPDRAGADPGGTFPS